MILSSSAFASLLAGLMVTVSAPSDGETVQNRETTCPVNEIMVYFPQDQNSMTEHAERALEHASSVARACGLGEAQLATSQSFSGENIRLNEIEELLEANGFKSRNIVEFRGADAPISVSPDRVSVSFR